MMHFPKVLALGLCAAAVSCSPMESADEIRTADVNGAAIEYVVSGPTDGEPLLFIHGGGLAETFAPIAVHPALSGYRLIRIHRRGYAGSSEHLGPFSLADQAADAAGLLRALGVERAHVVAHSYGASIALELAASFPERVHSLVVLEPAQLTAVAPALGRPDGAPPRDPGDLVRAQELYNAGDAAGAVEALFTVIQGDDWRAAFEVVPDGVAQVVADAPTLFEVEMPALLAWTFDAEQVAAIAAPALAMGGTESVGFPPAATQLLAELLGGADVRLIQGTDHALIAQEPDQVAEAIADFIGRQPM
jgi:pimeloyl-ACP methyl ester carboxylesterase